MPKDIRSDLAKGRAVRPRPLAIEAGIAPSTMYGLIDRNEVRAVRIGKCLSIPPEEARRVLGMTPPQATPSPADVREAA